MTNLYRQDVNGALARRAVCRAVVALAMVAMGGSAAFARLSTYTIKSELAAMGYRCLGKVRLRGAVYEVPACTPKGRKVLLRVDPDTARVLRVLRRD